MHDRRPRQQRGALHHVELWVPDLARALPRWSWLLGELGYAPHGAWEHGASFRLDATYLVLEQSPALIGDRHERLRPGLNHLAFHAGAREQLDAVVAASGENGWRLLFPERHPYAGGADHCAAYLEDDDGYAVELVAEPLSEPSAGA